MIQSPLNNTIPARLHVAIIMDGNGRWALTRGLPRTEGYRAGMGAVRRVVRAAPSFGIGRLTLYAFSSDNWERPDGEVIAVLRVIREFLLEDLETHVATGVRVNIIGRRDRLPVPLLAAIRNSQAATAGGRRIHLRIAVDYSSRDTILQAAIKLPGNVDPSQQVFARLLNEVNHADSPAADVDLLIRTGGEQRLSDFLLWECAYAELVFTKRMWPDFDATDLEEAVEELQTRDRRFGRLPEAVAG